MAYKAENPKFLNRLLAWQPKGQSGSFATAYLISYTEACKIAG